MSLRLKRDYLLLIHRSVARYGETAHVYYGAWDTSQVLHLRRGRVFSSAWVDVSFAKYFLVKGAADVTVVFQSLSHVLIFAIPWTDSVAGFPPPSTISVPSK